MATGGRHHSMPLPPAAAASTGKNRISSTSASALTNDKISSSSSGTSRAHSREHSARESITHNSNDYHHHPRDPALRDGGRDLSRDSTRDAAARDAGIEHGRTGQVRDRGRVSSLREDLSVRDSSSSRERREDLPVRDSSSSRERREDLLVRDSSSGRERREDLLVRDSSSSRERREDLLVIHSGNSKERREDLLVRDSSISREREGGHGKDHRVDRIRDRESAERVGRERMDRRDVNIGRQLQQRRREVAEGDRVVSPSLIPRPSSDGSGSGTLSIPRSPVTSPGDFVVEKEGGGGGEGRGSGARAGAGGNDAEREPGELTSESRVVESSWRGEVLLSMPLNMRNGRNLKQQSQESDAAAVGGKLSPPKKRKFSPIVWDYDEKQARPNKISSVAAGSSSTSISVTRFGGTQPSQVVVVQSSSSAFVEKSSSSPLNENVATPSMPPSFDRATPPGSGGAHSTRGRSSSPMGSTPSLSLVSARVSPVLVESYKEDFSGNHVEDEVMASAIPDDEPEPGQLLPEADSPMREVPVKIEVDDGEQDAPRPATIAASRWAEETHTSDGDKSPRAGGMKGRKRRTSSSESEEGRVSSGREGGHLTSGQSTSPEPGEYIREKVDPVPRGKDRANGSEGSGSGGHGSGGKDRRSNSIEDEEYERELNKRELMELDQEPSDDDEEEQRPEVEPEFDGVPPIPSGPQMRAIDMLQGCRSVDEFERLNRIDEGTYGVVYRARNKKTGEIVALKKVKMEKEKEGFPMTSLREINVLLSFHHPSVVDVKEVVVGSTIDSIFMVMEYMEHDLKGLMETMKQPFSQSEVKCLMLQLFEGVQYLHDNWVLHRDMKTSNLLLNNRGELKICDFGLARQYGSPLKPYTHMVVTLWYRAPELLLGSKNYQYSTAIDMWSLGCIMAEFLAKEALFNGKSEIDQIDKIFKTLGTPNEKIWPEFAKLPGVKCNFVKQPYNRLKERFPPTAFAGRPVLSQNGFDLLNRLLTYDPQKRITASEALKHEWFREVPLPKAKEFMPTFPARSEQDRRVRRLMKSPDPLEEQRKREIRQATRVSIDCAVMGSLESTGRTDYMVNSMRMPQPVCS